VRKRFFKWLPLLLLAVAAACGGSGRGPTDPGGPGGGPLPGGCGPYPDQASSPYVLPYPVGTAWSLTQTNCTGSHREGTFDQYAYDFVMPIGSSVVAARGGVVSRVEERYTDGNFSPDQANYVIVDHGDGTSALYWHLTRNGALVEVGDMVSQGQPIALSGNTGFSTEPHLHFSAFSGSLGIPITFRNTTPTVGALLSGQAYPALPY
jgi:murein DD-endopeptidase MepM/ murein hydrolase activator NlpD